MDALIGFAQSWCRLGDAVQSQFLDLMDQGPTADINPNAVDLMKTLLGSLEELDNEINDTAGEDIVDFSDDLDDMIKEWETENK